MDRTPKKGRTVARSALKVWERMPERRIMSAANGHLEQVRRGRLQLRFLHLAYEITRKRFGNLDTVDCC